MVTVISELGYENSIGHYGRKVGKKSNFFDGINRIYWIGKKA